MHIIHEHIYNILCFFHSFLFTRFFILLYSSFFTRRDYKFVRRNIIYIILHIQWLYHAEKISINSDIKRNNKKNLELYIYKTDLDYFIYTEI